MQWAMTMSCETGFVSLHEILGLLKWNQLSIGDWNLLNEFKLSWSCTWWSGSTHWWIKHVNVLAMHLAKFFVGGACMSDWRLARTARLQARIENKKFARDGRACLSPTWHACKVARPESATRRGGKCVSKRGMPKILKICLCGWYCYKDQLRMLFIANDQGNGIPLDTGL